MQRFDEDLLESQVNAAIANIMRRRGYLVLQRQRFNPCEWDILMLSRDSLKIAAIEIKRRSWRALLSQAIRAKLFSHYVIAALPHKFRQSVPKQEFTDLGIGLAFYKGQAESLRLRIDCKPALSLSISRAFKRQVYRRFRELCGENLYG